MERRLLVGALGLLPGSLFSLDGEAAWRAFLGWCRRQPVEVTALRAGYERALRGQGLGEAEVAARLEVVDRFSRTRRDELQRILFDRTYASAEPRFRSEPNRFLVEAVRGRKPGRALDVHMGNGRNALYLAARGWRVAGFDYSEVGVEEARRRARARRLSLEACVERHERFDFGVSKWDLIVMCYTWVPLGAPWGERIVAALRPGGLLVFEHMLNTAEGEGGAPWLPRPGRVAAYFPGLRAERVEELTARPDWAWRPEPLVRLLASR